ncbi:hypothetical protein A7K50_12470 [Dehalobacter sp. MCB1]|nr:hypothetical protein A7K50_12470 [Dehalobacter sp. MCB1]
MDDTIDEKDVAYVEGVIKGTNAATNLSDANYDGKVDSQDVDQIEQIINGTEKTLIIKDDDGTTVIIPKPIKRAVASGRVYDVCEVMRSLNVANLLVGVSKEIQDRNIYFPELSKLHGVGTAWEPDYEAIIQLDPDIVMISGRTIPSSSRYAGYKEKLEGATPVVYLALQLEENLTERITKMGYIFNCRDDAETFIEWHDSIIDEIESKTENLAENEKPRVFPTFYSDGSWNVYPGSYGSIPEMCAIAGGKNIGDVWSSSEHSEVDLEWIATQNPDIIVAFPTYLCGYENSSPDFNSLKNNILGTPILQNVSAVKKNKVYVICANCFEYAPSRIVMIAQMAKWYHPDLFVDLDPIAIHQEYLTKFQKIEFDVAKNEQLFALS